MKGNFSWAFAAVLKHEGGYVNHPHDPGGMTNFGVTKRVWDDWVERQSTEEEMRSLTPEMVEPLYRARYWDAVQGDALPSGVDYAIYDFGVNSGPQRAAIIAQRVARVTQDGIIGPKTLAAIEAYCDEHGAKNFIMVYSKARESFLRSISATSVAAFNVFGRGWMRRVGDVEAMASRMAGKETA